MMKKYLKYIQRKEKSRKRVWTCINFIIVSQLKDYRRNYLHFYGHEKSFELNGNISKRCKTLCPCNIVCTYKWMLWELYLRKPKD